MQPGREPAPTCARGSQRSEHTAARSRAPRGGAAQAAAGGGQHSAAPPAPRERPAAAAAFLPLPYASAVQRHVRGVATRTPGTRAPLGGPARPRRAREACTLQHCQMPPSGGSARHSGWRRTKSQSGRAGPPGVNTGGVARELSAPAGAATWKKRVPLHTPARAVPGTAETIKPRTVAANACRRSSAPVSTGAGGGFGRGTAGETVGACGQCLQATVGAGGRPCDRRATSARALPSALSSRRAG